MATLLNTSTFSGSNGSHFHLNLYYDLLSQSIQNNTSTVRYYLYFQADPTYYGYGSTAYGYINGLQVGSTTSLPAGTTQLIGTSDVIIAHDDLGYASASYSASITTPWGLGSASVSGSIPLPTIPRASQPTATSANIEDAITIYTNRKSGSFTHTLKYSFGSLSGTIATGVTDSYAWTLPSDFYAQIPNSSYGIGTITCETYNGSQLIGTNTCEFTAYASEAKCKPTVSITVTDTSALATSLTGSNQKLVKFVSNPKVIVASIAKNSATIKSTSVSCGDGKSNSGSDVTFSAVESGYFKGNVTDSRGFNNSAEKTLDIIDYIKLTCNVDVIRESNTSNVVNASISGNFFDDSFGSVANTLSLKVRYCESGTESWSQYFNITPEIKDDNTYSADVTIGTEFDYQKKYEFEFIATDKITSVTASDSVTQGIPPFAVFKEFIELWGIKAFEIIEEEEEV